MLLHIVNKTTDDDEVTPVKERDEIDFQKLLQAASGNNDAVMRNKI